MGLKVMVTSLAVATTAALAFAGAPISATTDESAAAGKSLVAQHCVSCHALTIVDDRRATEAEWQEIVERMVLFGADVDDAKAKDIVKYLSATHNRADG